MSEEIDDHAFNAALEGLTKKYLSEGITLPVSSKSPKEVNVSELAKLLGVSRQTLNKQNPIGLQRRAKINAVAQSQGLKPWLTQVELLAKEINSTAEHYKNKATEAQKDANTAKRNGAEIASTNEALMIENLELKDEIERLSRENRILNQQLAEFANTGMIRGINRAQ